jgi:hypothetical protein
MVDDEIIFLVEETDAGFSAQATDDDALTVEAETWEELREQVRALVREQFEPGARPDHIRLQLIRVELVRV